MLDLFPTAAMVFGIVVVLLGFARVRAARHLEAKIGLLRTVLILYTVALALTFAAALVHGSDQPRLPAVSRGLPAEGLHDDVVALRQYALLSRAHAREGTLLFAGILLQLALLLPSLVHVLRELGTFVLVHRTDLLGRDQAAGSS